MDTKVLSLFSGAMGLDLGLEMAGLEVTTCVESNPIARKTIHQNKPGLELIDDVRGYFPVGDFFAVVGGPPCQAFSLAGKRMSFDDPRGVLAIEFGRVVSVVRPRFFVMENVRGITSARIDEYHQPGSVLKALRDGFREMGYVVKWEVLDAVNYGVPQHRERMIMVGSRDGEEIILPRPTHFRIHQNPKMRWKTTRSSILDLEDNPGPGKRFSDLFSELLGKIPPGGNWKDLGVSDQKRGLGSAYAIQGGKSSFLKRLSYDEPSPTLITTPVNRSTTLCHPNKTRPLSVREYARIQTFPDNWKFEGPVDSQYKMIGNAVPVLLGKAIGKTLLAIASGNAKVKSKRSTRRSSRARNDEKGLLVIFEKG